MRRAARTCNESGDDLSASCVKSFGELFTKLLRARYPEANDQRLLSWCQEHVEDCHPRNIEKLWVLELDFLKAHNRSVFATLQRTQGEAARQEQSDVVLSLDRRQQVQEEESLRQVRVQMMRDVVEATKQPEK